MKYKLKNIKPNPFRNIDNYPINKEKVAALRESIGHTGFWDNVVARANNGAAEIAYGHHRLAALKKEFGDNHEVDLIVKPFSDETMIKVMARENMEEWGSNAQIEMETVKAVVQAFAEGRIKLKPVKTGSRGSPGKIRCAPSFIARSATNTDPLYYNTQTVAEFIGWLEPSGEAQDKVATALNALELIEKGASDESDFADIGTKQAEALVSQTRATLKWREESRMPQTAIPKAREVSQKIAKTFRESKERKGAKFVAGSVRFNIDRRPKPIPNIERFVEGLWTRIAYILSSRDKMTEQILEVLKCIDGLDKDNRVELEIQLRKLATRAKIFADMVKTGKGVPKRELVPLLRA
jgi:hypothetical protein